MENDTAAGGFKRREKTFESRKDGLKPRGRENDFSTAQNARRVAKRIPEAAEKFRDTRQDHFLSALSPNLNVMIKAVQKAGRSLMRDFGEVEHLQVSRKGAADFVSAADMNSERILRAFLKEARPRYGFLMEESGVVAGADTSHHWVIDPLDGTMNFLHGIAHFSVSLALREDNEIIAGVVYNPVTNELYYAEKGGGAWSMTFSGNYRLRVSGRRNFNESVVATGIPHLGHGHAETFIEQLKPMMALTGGVRRMGAASLDLAYVAAGKLDCFWEEDLKPWDVAAGVLLVKEAGGHVCTLDGDEKTKTVLEGKSIVAANDNLYAPFMRLLKNKAQK